VIVRSTIDPRTTLIDGHCRGCRDRGGDHRLLAFGCDAAQGTFVSPPRSAEATRSWFASLQ
jgi:EAL domain-containing protein (putative c-di-GMP-specific phosphodiesterase class I)